MIEFLLAHWEVILAIVSFLATAAAFVIVFIKRLRTIKASTTKDQREAVLGEIKSAAYGLINVAEHTFSDIPSSGASKLLYVLSHIKDLCFEKDVDYDGTFWEGFVNQIVADANNIQSEMADEHEKLEIVEQIKTLIPDFIQEANRMFVSVPGDAERYKIAYVVGLIEAACEDYDIDVSNMFDWKAYVTELYESKKAG